MNFQLSPSCANLHHTINLPAWFYMCCYVRLTLVCTQCMFVYFHILHWKYNHSTLSFVSLTNVVYCYQKSLGQGVVKLQMGESSGGFSNAGLLMVSLGRISSRLWSQFAVWLVEPDPTRPIQDGKMWRCDAENFSSLLQIIFFMFPVSSI